MDALLQQYVSLTEIDALIVATEGQLAAYPKMLAAMDGAERQQTKAIEEARAESDAAARERRAAEKAVLDLREKVVKYTSQQGAVKTNKEYEALNHEMDRIREQIDAQETTGLEKLVIEEDCATRLTEAETLLARLREQHAGERKRIEGQIAEKRERLERVRAEREAAAAPLEEEERESYESVNKRNPGTACAPMDGDHCAVCGWQLTPHVRQEVNGGKLARCEHCRRFLYNKS
jgi:predicted  nucleic acid-binding Zn-ribbon protein